MATANPSVSFGSSLCENPVGPRWNGPHRRLHRKVPPLRHPPCQEEVDVRLALAELVGRLRLPYTPTPPQSCYSQSGQWLGEAGSCPAPGHPKRPFLRRASRHPAATDVCPVQRPPKRPRLRGALRRPARTDVCPAPAAAIRPRLRGAQKRTLAPPRGRLNVRFCAVERNAPQGRTFAPPRGRLSVRDCVVC